MFKKILVGIIILITILAGVVTIRYHCSIESKISDKLGETGVKELILSQVPIGTEWGDVIKFLECNGFYESKDPNDYSSCYTYDTHKGYIELIIMKWTPFIEDYYIAIGFQFTEDKLSSLTVGFFP